MNTSFYICMVGRVMAIDYGKKRTGIATTDPLKILASPLTTVNTPELASFLADYIKKEDVETIVVGLPLNSEGEHTHATQGALDLAKRLDKKYPQLNIEMENEAFTSKRAVEAMVQGGMKKKERRKKENIDKVSAALILQSYLGID